MTHITTVFRDRLVTAESSRRDVSSQVRLRRLSAEYTGQISDVLSSVFLHEMILLWMYE